jgi:hypothetical protein
MGRKKQNKAQPPHQPPALPNPVRADPSGATLTRAPSYGFRWLGENPLFAIFVLIGFTAASAWIAHELEFCEYVKDHDLLGPRDPEFHKVWLGALPASGITALTAYRIRHSPFWTSFAQVLPASAVLFALLVGFARMGAERKAGHETTAAPEARTSEMVSDSSDVWHRADAVLTVRPNQFFSHVVRIYNLPDHGSEHRLCRRGGPRDDVVVETRRCVPLQRGRRPGVMEARITGVAPELAGRYAIQYKIEGGNGEWAYPRAEPVNIAVWVGN